MSRLYTTGQVITGFSIIALAALNAIQAKRNQEADERLAERVRVLQGAARQNMRLLNAHRMFERELQEELHREERLLAALMVYVRMVELYGVESREEIEDIYLRYDIITESYQRIIDQRNQTIKELHYELRMERRTINNLINALFDLRQQLDDLKGN